MYSIARTKDFEKSYRRLKHSGKFKKQAKDKLEQVIDLLASNKKLPREYQDY
jgi:mRNA-degrading endonuclease YafQ of YafQ-DinJ toxin-antitoxin module